MIPVRVPLETYSILTRLPVRVAPGDARQMLEESFAETAEIAGGLDSGAAWSLIQELSLREMGGGIVYDARTALAAGASVLLTWNIRDFLRIAPAGLEIRHP